MTLHPDDPQSCSVLAHAYSQSAPFEAQLLARRIGSSKLPCTLQHSYTMFHLCEHHAAGTADNSFRREHIRKFSIMSESHGLLVQLIGIKACPKDHPLPLQLPEEHFVVGKGAASMGKASGTDLLGPVPLLHVRFLYYSLEMEKAGKLPSDKQHAISDFLTNPAALGDDTIHSTPGAFAMVEITAESVEELSFTNAKLVENQQYILPYEEQYSGFAESILYPTDSRILHAVTPVDRPLPRPSILFRPIPDSVTMAGLQFQHYSVSTSVPAPGTEVIVKVQPPTGQGPWLYYDGSDETSADNIQTFRGMVPEDADGLANARLLLQQHGIRQRTAQGSIAYKAFLRARAEGDSMRLFLDVFEDGFVPAVEPADKPADSLVSERRSLIRWFVNRFAYTEEEATFQVSRMTPAQMLREIQIADGDPRNDGPPMATTPVLAWDLLHLTAGYFPVGFAFVGSLLADIAATFDAHFLDDGPRGRPSEGTIRFVVEELTERQGLCIDIDAVTRSDTGCPILHGWWCHNSRDDPGFTTAQLEFVMQDCGPGLAYGMHHLKASSEHFHAMQVCLKQSSVHGALAAQRRKEAALREWGYVYPEKLSGFVPFAIEGKQSGRNAPGLRGPGTTRTDLAENPNPQWRVEKAQKAELLRRAETLATAEELYSQADRLRKGKDHKAAFALYYEADAIHSTIGDPFPIPRLQFTSEARRDRCRKIHIDYVSKAADRGDAELESFLQIMEAVKEKTQHVTCAVLSTPDSDAAPTLSQPVTRRSSSASLRGEFSSGDQVTICGLANAKEHNGKRGTLQNFNKKTGRWNVEIQGLLKTLNIKPGNLCRGHEQEFLPGQHVMIKHLQSASHLNGQTGKVLRWHGSKQRYEVKITHGGVTKFIKPLNLERSADTTDAVPSTAAEQTREKDDDKKNLKHKQRKKSTLIIEGMNIISAEDNFMTESIRQGCDKPKPKRVNFHYGERPDAISKCQRELTSGVYTSVIVSDLSCEFQTFQDHLGEYLQTFVRLGGVVAFLSAEGGQLQSTLQALFGTTWTPGGYFRTTWGVAPENQPAVREWFGSSAATSFSVKASTVRGVPASERCFGTTPASRHESISMRMMQGGAVPVGQGGPQDPSDNPDVPIDTDYDIVVAVHRYYDGAIAWFGDVNCETATVEQVLQFCERCGPDEPVDMSSFSTLSASEFESVLRLKTTGNAAFKQGSFAEANSSYAAALGIYGSREGSGSEQRNERVNLSSNMAECLIRQEMFEQAIEAASKALSYDGANVKARLRRVKALAALDGSDNLKQAWDDLKVLHSAGENSDVLAKLTRQVRAKRQASNSREAGGLRAAFASGSSGLSDAADESRQKAAWSSGMAPPDLFEWFCNCYQMRCDDNYMYQGEFAGPYDPGADGKSIAQDFMIFCLLAARNKVVPADWDWAEFLQAAPRWIIYAFEESDAQERWGSENVFQAQMGGRSLRHTAMDVYGLGPDAFDVTKEELRARDDAEAWAYENVAASEEVGGPAAWQQLLAALRAEKG